jgi:hypothetical protein
MNNSSISSSNDSTEKPLSCRDCFRRPIFGLVWVAGLFALIFPIVAAAQTNIVNSLDPAELNSALQAGGTVTFATNGTIVLTNTITLSNDVILDGTNHSITISGGGAVEIFNVPPGLSLTLRNLTLANGLKNGDYVNM